MEATIKFNLENESDQHLYEIVTNASKLLLAIHDYDQKLRSMHKYEDKEEAYNYRQLLRGILQDHNVNHLV